MCTSPQLGKKTILVVKLSKYIIAVLTDVQNPIPMTVRIAAN